MAGGHSSRSWTARRNLILEKGVIYRRTVSNHRGGRKKSYLMEKILCPTVLRANNWRTPRKVAYIALLSRGANCNTIRSGAFCRWKNLARTNRFFELAAFSKSGCMPIECVSMKHCVVGENCGVFLSFFPSFGSFMAH